MLGAHYIKGIQMKTLLLFVLAASMSLAQTTVSLGNVVLSADAVESVKRHLLGQVSRDLGRLNAPVSAAATSLTFAVAPSVSVGDAIVVDSEAMSVTAVSATTVTVTRSILTTTATAHARGSQVQSLKYTSFRDWIRAILTERVSLIMDQYPAGAIATANTAITTAEQSKITAKANAVQ